MAYKTIIGTMKTAGTLDLSAGDIDLAAGSVDNADLAGSIANSKLANDSVTVTAGNGLSGGGEVDLGASISLALDLNELSAVAIASGDFLPLIDATDNSTKKESIDDLATFMAGAGLAAAAGVLSARLDVATKADGGTLAAGMNFFADLSANATVALPASPAVGDTVIVKAKGLSNAVVIINKAGAQTIDGEASVVIESPYGAVSMVYVANNDWRLV